MDGRSLFNVAVDVNAASMVLDRGVRCCQPEAHLHRFRRACEINIEDPFELLWWNPASVVDDVYAEINTIFIGADDDFPAY